MVRVEQTMEIKWFEIWNYILGLSRNGHITYGCWPSYLTIIYLPIAKLLRNNNHLPIANLVLNIYPHQRRCSFDINTKRQMFSFSSYLGHPKSLYLPSGWHMGYWEYEQVQDVRCTHNCNMNYD